MIEGVGAEEGCIERGCVIIFSALAQGSQPWRCGRFGLDSSLGVVGCTVHWKMLYSIPALYPLDARGTPSPAGTPNHVSRHCQMSPGGHSHLWLRITDLAPQVASVREGRERFVRVLRVCGFEPAP